MHNLLSYGIQHNINTLIDLHVLVMKGGNKLEINIDHKLTDSKQYILISSRHWSPPDTCTTYQLIWKNGFALKYITETQQLKILEELSIHLGQRKYPKSQTDSERNIDGKWNRYQRP